MSGGCNTSVFEHKKTSNADEDRRAARNLYKFVRKDAPPKPTSAHTGEKPYACDFEGRACLGSSVCNIAKVKIPAYEWS
jgi:hypothetical protein